jgi:predicted metalloprotease
LITDQAIVRSYAEQIRHDSFTHLASRNRIAAMLRTLRRTQGPQAAKLYALYLSHQFFNRALPD